MTRRAPGRRFFHPAKGRPYHEANSRRGVLEAVTKGYEWIDLDAQVCWLDERRTERVILNAHWNQALLRDGFYDPAGKIRRTARLSDLTLAEVRRLRTRDGYVIRTMVEQIEFAHAHGIGVELEPKAHRAFERPSTWADVAAARERLGARVVVKTLNNIGGRARKRLEAAKLVGFKTMLLARRPARGGPAVDWIRGAWKGL